MTDNFEVFIEDAGDSSVGIPSEQVFKAELCKNMVEYLKENKKLREFEKRLEELITEFYDAETYYMTFDTVMLEAVKEI